MKLILEKVRLLKNLIIDKHTGFLISVGDGVVNKYSCNSKNSWVSVLIIKKGRGLAIKNKLK